MKPSLLKKRKPKVLSTIGPFVLHNRLGPVIERRLSQSPFPDSFAPSIRHTSNPIPLEQKSLHTTLIVGEWISQLHAHQLHNFNCWDLCNACVSLVSVCLSCLYLITGRQLHNNNARAINIQLHTHTRQLHNNNCWGVNSVIIPAPMVL